MADKKPSKKKKEPIAKASEIPINRTTTDKFDKTVEFAKKHVQNYESSSDEEDVNGKDLFTAVFKNYAGNQNDLERTQHFLEDSLRSGAEICLICIGTVKRVDAVSDFITVQLCFYIQVKEEKCLRH
jgi:hypothetical protein